MRTISLKQLQKEYQEPGTMFVEVTNKKDALSQIESKASCCWGAGQKFGDTGWIVLASPSKQHVNDVRTVFVCKAELVGK